MTTMRGIMQGFAPGLAVQPGNPEAIKYGTLWELPEYRAYSPGEQYAQLFLSIARPKRGAHVIDFGCGTGRGALMLAVLGGCKVTMVDFVRNCLDPEIQEALTTQAHALQFVKADLERPLPVAAEYGFCCDVMEHIPGARVDQVLDNILHAAQHVFFSIATKDDACGKLIGEPLHMTVQSYGWWLQKLAQRDAVVHWSKEEDGACFFYVTAWQDGQAVVDVGKPNIEEAKIRENVRHNCGQGWPQVQPEPTNDLEVMILGGGPSLAQFEADIRQKRAEGVKLITLNGTYNWCLERGLTPSAQIIVDARPFNARFTKPVVDHCKYFIASQCDPSVFEGLPKDRTYLWHTTAEMIADILKEHYDVWWGVPGGSTVLLRAIPLLRMGGYRKFHLYGCDSCLSEKDMGYLPTGSYLQTGGDRWEHVWRYEHHAYAQPENDKEPVFPVTVTGGRVFYCHPWMLSQAQEMMSLIKFLGEEIELEIYGDGLLAHILKTGAEIADGDS